MAGPGHMVTLGRIIYPLEKIGVLFSKEGRGSVCFLERKNMKSVWLLPRCGSSIPEDGVFSRPSSFKIPWQLFLFSEPVLRYCWGLEAPLYRAKSAPLVLLHLSVWKMKMTVKGSSSTLDVGHAPVPALFGPDMLTCLSSNPRMGLPVDTPGHSQSVSPSSQDPQTPP